MLSQKRILISPINWGLGHATRCIPIIRLLIKHKATVIVATEGRPLALLKHEFPNLEFITLKGYSISYPHKGSMLLKMFFSIPSILLGIYREHQELKKIVTEKNLDVIISDNRYGLWNKKVKSIFISHQLFIKAPFGEMLIHKINQFFINKYDQCWVPDNEGVNNLSGELAHKQAPASSTLFIGPLSRFENKSPYKANAFAYDVMAIVSGPEPQRTIFEKLVIEQFKASNLKAIIVCGKPEEAPKRETINNLEIVSHLNTSEMEKAILSSKIIVARSGYSTIMDMATLEKKCVFIPTPGQTEQEYLAEKLSAEKIASSQSQKDFNLLKAIKEVGKTSGFKNSTALRVLNQIIEGL